MFRLDVFRDLYVPLDIFGTELFTENTTEEFSRAQLTVHVPNFQTVFTFTFTLGHPVYKRKIEKTPVLWRTDISSPSLPPPRRAV